MWGNTHLTKQQNRVWRRLIACRECPITTLFIAARPNDPHSQFTLRQQHHTVGMVISGINKRLKLTPDSRHIVRTGDSRFSYCLEPPLL